MECFTVTEHGFYGLYHPAAQPFKPGLAVIILGGSEGNENVPREVSRLFSEKGITAMGLCYWNVPGLPTDLVRIPLEPFEAVLRFLNDKGFDEVYLYGISEGAKLALLVASLMPGYKGVVALSPIHCLWNGMIGNEGLFKKKPAEACEFTYKGQDFPYMRFEIKKGPGIKNLIFKHQIELDYIYTRPLKAFREETAIPVEQINGDILFIHPAEDLMWPSPDAVRYMVERLRSKGFSHRVKTLCYEKASHIIVPLDPKQLRLFKVERRFPEECRASRQDAFRQTIRWLLQDSEERENEL